MSDDHVFDFQRQARIGLAEAVLCEGKTPGQIDAIIATALGNEKRLLLTRLAEYVVARLDAPMDYDPLSRTGIVGAADPPAGAASVAVVTAGTSDLPVAREAIRTLGFYGKAVTEINDVGVAGLWRLLAREDDLRRHACVIVVAGMEGALFSVVAGLVPGMVIAVPTSTGYGAANGGNTALHAALSSCAPGVVVVNIDNGYGAASAALRFLAARDQ